MSDQPRKLDQIQRWIQAVITHPQGVEAGIDSTGARSEIDVDLSDVESVVTPSGTRTGVERLAVYGNAYYARLLECMREFFPAMVHALSEEVFDAFTLRYLNEHPSQSYTLNRLADNFVEHLQQTRSELDEDDDPAVGDGQDPSVGWPEFLIDLARLEWTIDEVFDGPGVEGKPLLTAEVLQVIDPERWPAARLVPVPCLRLLAFRFPVNQYYTDFRHGDSPEMPDVAETYLALNRRDYVVRRLELSQPQYELLSALASGQTVGQAVAEAARSVEEVESFSASLAAWFQLWAAEGFFESIETDETS